MRESHMIYVIIVMQHFNKVIFKVDKISIRDGRLSEVFQSVEKIYNNVDSKIFFFLLKNIRVIELLCILI